jgi:DNA-binding transcriptional regulator YiaG
MAAKGKSTYSPRSTVIMMEDLVPEKIKEVLKTPMQDTGMLVRPDFLSSFREALGLSQVELALLLGCTNISIHLWEKKGITDVKGPAYGNFKTLIAIFKHAFRYPETIDPEMLCDFVQSSAKRTLIEKFFPRAAQIEPEILSSVNLGTVSSVLLALIIELVVPSKETVTQ